MAELTLTKLRFRNAVWEGIVTGGQPAVPPDIRVTHQDLPVDEVDIAKADTDGQWHLKIKIPSHAIADGVQTFLITDASSDQTLGHFSLIAGEDLDDDIRAEVELLRAELDMLKRAFRRHCLETA